MTQNRNFKRRIRLRASKTGESYSSARRQIVPTDRSVPMFEEQAPDDYLLRAARSAAGKAYKSLAIEQLGIDADSVVLDIGCGTGGELEALLRAIGPEGSVIGVDTNNAALTAARERYGDTRLCLLEADAHSLDLADGSVDRVYADRTVQHLNAPGTMLNELRRVLRPGGRAVFAEPDWRTLLVDCPEPSLADAYQRFVVDQVIRNARIGTELPRLVREADLELESVTPITATYTKAVEADRVLGFARVTRRAVAAGYLARADADRWLGYLSGDIFFASLTIFAIAARRPSSH